MLPPPLRLSRAGLLRAADLSLSLERTLRVPRDGGTYPLPPSCGRLGLREGGWGEGLGVEGRGTAWGVPQLTYHSGICTSD